MPYFTVIMRVQYGEYEETKHYLLKAHNLEQARETAQRYAQQYYGGEPAEDNGVFYHNGGTVGTQIRGVHETSLLEFIKSCLSRYTIYGCPPPIRDIVV